MGKKRKQFDGNNAEFGINERSNYESQQKKSCTTLNQM